MPQFQQETAVPRTDDLLPIVIPTSIVQNPAWPGPFIPWNDVLSVTWAHFQDPCNTVYLSRAEAAELERRHIDFAGKALENLRARSKPNAWSHIKQHQTTVFFVALLQDDGVGPSRLLLRDELHAVFPQGYSFCVPERTCAVVFSRQAGQAELASVQHVVAGCFQKGREPVSTATFDENIIK